VVIAILGVISAIAVPAVLNTLKDSKVKADVATAQSIIKSVNLAIVSANSDTTDTNDIATISNAELSSLDGNLLTELEKSYPDIKDKVTQCNSGSDFTLTITDVDVFAGTISFSDGTKTHTIDQNGKDTIS